MKDIQGMTNAETAKAIGGVAISATGAFVVSRADQIEQWSRIGASWVAIISGCFVIYSVVSKHCKKRKSKHEKN